MNNLATYTIKGKESGYIWRFKYNLDGSLYSFEVLEGTFSERQSKWLFEGGRFPYKLSMIDIWKKHLTKNFEIEESLPAYTFDVFWDMYAKKQTKKQSCDFWKKMKEADRVKAIQGIRRYNNFLRLNPWRDKVDPIRYLKHRRYEDYD